MFGKDWNIFGTRQLGPKELVDLQATYNEWCRTTEECSPFGTELETCLKKLKAENKVESCWKHFLDYATCVNKCGLNNYILSEEVKESVGTTISNTRVGVGILDVDEVNEKGKGYNRS